MTGPRLSAAWMTWQGTKTAGLAAKEKTATPGKDSVGWAPKCFVSRWKVQRKLWTPENRERTAIARPAEAQPVFRLHASLEATRRAPFKMGRPMALDCTPP